MTRQQTEPWLEFIEVERTEGAYPMQAMEGESVCEQDWGDFCGVAFLGWLADDAAREAVKGYREVADTDRRPRRRRLDGQRCPVLRARHARLLHLEVVVVLHGAQSREPVADRLHAAARLARLVQQLARHAGRGRRRRTGRQHPAAPARRAGHPVERRGAGFLEVVLDLVLAEPTVRPHAGHAATGSGSRSSVSPHSAHWCRRLSAQRGGW